MTTYPTKKRVILCVDDDQAILRYEKALLERSGYAVLTAETWEQGLRLATVCKCDCVLLDYEMPVMNGYELAFEMKRANPNLIVIMVSGCEVPAHALSVADAFIPKLEASRELLPMIAELCCGSRDGSQTGSSLRVEDGPPPPPGSVFEYGPQATQAQQGQEDDA